MCSFGSNYISDNVDMKPLLIPMIKKAHKYQRLCKVDGRTTTPMLYLVGNKHSI